MIKAKHVPSMLRGVILAKSTIAGIIVNAFIRVRRTTSSKNIK